MFRIYFIFVVISGFSSLSNSVALSQERELMPYVGTASFCNVPAYQAKNPNIASVTRYRGQNVIIIDPSVRVDERWLKFVIAHECGHVKLGHLNRRSALANRTIKGFVKKRELDADCWAAKNAPRLAAEYAFYYFRDGKNNKTHSSYPTGKERAQNLRECARF